MIAAFAACRRDPADAGQRRILFLAQQQRAEDLIGQGVEEALADLAWELGARPVRAAIDKLRISLRAYEWAERRGLDRLEQRLRRSTAVPTTFAANPAQAFFTLQRRLAERRRRAAAEYDELTPDEAVSLAA